MTASIRRHGQFDALVQTTADEIPGLVLYLRDFGDYSVHSVSLAAQQTRSKLTGRTYRASTSSLLPSVLCENLILVLQVSGPHNGQDFECRLVSELAPGQRILPGSRHVSFSGPSTPCCLPLSPFVVSVTAQVRELCEIW